MIRNPRTPTVLKLGAAQTLAWASSYYLPAMLAVPMARDLGVAPPAVFAAFSLALVISGLLGPLAGRRIDLLGGRPMLMASNGLFVGGLLALAVARGPVSLFAAWALLGVAMSCGLYEAAFASLVRLYGGQARNAITGITLLAGLASTVGWPLTTLFEAQFGWRGACVAWALLHVVVGLPLNAWLPRVPHAPHAPHAGPVAPPEGAQGEAQAPPLARPRFTAAVLAFVFAVIGFISTAMAAHLPGLLLAGGASMAGAVAVGALVGPAQVAGRLLEFSVLRRAHPLWSARAAALGPPLGAAVLGLFGPPAALLFALLHGAGNGMLTIAKGTLPLALFGAAGYGARQGLLMLPARFAAAGAPLVFGLALQRWGAGAVWVSAVLGLSACVALALLPGRVATARNPPARNSPG